jgi:hypothetical protein
MTRSQGAMLTEHLPAFVGVQLDVCVFQRDDDGEQGAVLSKTRKGLLWAVQQVSRGLRAFPPGTTGWGYIGIGSATRIVRADYASGVIVWKVASKYATTEYKLYGELALDHAQLESPNRGTLSREAGGA